MVFERRQAGFVIVVVLCMVMLMTVLLLIFNSRCRADLLSAAGFRKSQQALSCAQAGLNIAIAGLMSDSDLPRLLGRTHYFDVDEAGCAVTIIDESAKLNVNLLKHEHGDLDRPKVDHLLRLIDVLNRSRSAHPRIRYGLVPAVIDWIDKDDEVTSLPFVNHGNTGAESFHYSRLATPYRCKNASLEAADELLLVKGITPEVFDRMSDHVTVYGQGQININCATEEVIESLAEEMDSALARMLVAKRKAKPFESIAEIRDAPGMTQSLFNKIRGSISVGPAGTEQYYNIVAEGKVDETTCTVSAVLRKDTRAKTVDVVWYKELNPADVIDTR
jgi:general secretion pathway protein K